MSRSVLKVIEKPSYMVTRYGGIELNGGEFIIIDDPMKDILKKEIVDRCGETLNLQLTSYAEKVLSEFQYVVVYETTVLGIKFIEIEGSPVPPFAWNAYINNINDEEVKNQIIGVVNAYMNVRVELSEEDVKRTILVGNGKEFDFLTQEMLAALTGNKRKYMIPLVEFSSISYLCLLHEVSFKEFQS